MLDGIELAIRGGNLAAAEKQTEGKEAEQIGKDRRPTADGTVKPRRRSGKTDAGDAQVGKVLRSVYQQTVDEAVPPEMLDLLNKLG